VYAIGSALWQTRMRVVWGGTVKSRPLPDYDHIFYFGVAHSFDCRRSGDSISLITGTSIEKPRVLSHRIRPVQKSSKVEAFQSESESSRSFLPVNLMLVKEQRALRPPEL